MLSKQQLVAYREHANLAIRLGNPYQKAIVFVGALDLIEMLDRLECCEADMAGDDTQPGTPGSKHGGQQ